MQDRLRLLGHTAAGACAVALLTLNLAAQSTPPAPPTAPAPEGRPIPDSAAPAYRPVPPTNPPPAQTVPPAAQLNWVPVPAPAEKSPSKDTEGSAYIPVDSWVYPAVMRLYSLGYVDSVFIGIRPWTRRSLLHILDHSADSVLKSRRDQRPFRHDRLTLEAMVDRVAQGPSR